MLGWGFFDINIRINRACFGTMGTIGDMVINIFDICVRLVLIRNSVLSIIGLGTAEVKVFFLLLDAA